MDSPDFTLRVAEKVKKINPSIKSVHYVAPQVWIWREKRVKKYQKFLDHLLLLFNFEKEYLVKQLKKNDGNVSKTAKSVGMDRTALHRKLSSLNIKH